jgi:hypothetical protein
MSRLHNNRRRREKREKRRRAKKARLQKRIVARQAERTTQKTQSVNFGRRASLSGRHYSRTHRIVHMILCMLYVLVGFSYLATNGHPPKAVGGAYCLMASVHLVICRIEGIF